MASLSARKSSVTAGGKASPLQNTWRTDDMMRRCSADKAEAKVASIDGTKCKVVTPAEWISSAR
ncbi:hypothetical protein GCM10011410_13320 [Hoyosella rhizosphaerae]|uniref:Uncharacterized protein n=1 Tax=Hoyosella rhizosphaerae TaxID=1755582 RepID=A0A916U881_9ACTN|nr:hypothetical protein GCM10011410_13320 [Hoyosella rhizosphaerae]